MRSVLEMIEMTVSVVGMGVVFCLPRGLSTVSQQLHVVCPGPVDRSIVKQHLYPVHPSRMMSHSQHHAWLVLVGDQVSRHVAMAEASIHYTPVTARICSSFAR